jgi:hypothetical protein
MDGNNNDHYNLNSQGQLLSELLLVPNGDSYPYILKLSDTFRKYQSTQCNITSFSYSNKTNHDKVKPGLLGRERIFGTAGEVDEMVEDLFCTLCGNWRLCK